MTTDISLQIEAVSGTLIAVPAACAAYNLARSYWYDWMSTWPSKSKTKGIYKDLAITHRAIGALLPRLMGIMLILGVATGLIAAFYKLIKAF